MKLHTDPLEPETYYHIYNRGINKENIFKEDRNYSFFLERYTKFIAPVAETYSYCLLKNHFHVLIRTRSEGEIRMAFPLKEKLETGRIISMQFSHLFNSYAQAVNKSFKRTGGLFETPFRRIAVRDAAYRIGLMRYIHLNPGKHGFTDDFKTYPWSSYLSYRNAGSDTVEREAGLAWFGGEKDFIKYHETPDSGEDIFGDLM